MQYTLYIYFTLIELFYTTYLPNNYIHCHAQSFTQLHNIHILAGDIYTYSYTFTLAETGLLSLIFHLMFAAWADIAFCLSGLGNRMSLIACPAAAAS